MLATIIALVQCFIPRVAMVLLHPSCIRNMYMCECIWC
jgi:hypothetical protein